MILDQVTDQQMAAGRMLTALTMVGLLAAPLAGRFAGRVRLAVTAAYIGCVACAAIYLML
jgi:hypothetical protein